MVAPGAVAIETAFQGAGKGEGGKNKGLSPTESDSFKGPTCKFRLMHLFVSGQERSCSHTWLQESLGKVSFGQQAA